MHCPGNKHLAPDATSRHPGGTIPSDRLHLPDDVACTVTRHEILTTLREDVESYVNTVDESIVDTVTEALATTDLKMVTWDRVKEATVRDTTMSLLVETIEAGFPDERDATPHIIQDFYQFRNDLYTVDGVVIYNERVVVPPSYERRYSRHCTQHIKASE